MPYIEMRFDPTKKLVELCQTAVGRAPVAMGIGDSTLLQAEFSPPLTATEKVALRNALPAWMRQMFVFEEKEGSIVSVR